jgi:hypothetical protein
MTYTKKHSDYETILFTPNSFKNSSSAGAGAHIITSSAFPLFGNA